MNKREMDSLRDYNFCIGTIFEKGMVFNQFFCQEECHWFEEMAENHYTCRCPRIKPLPENLREPKPIRKKIKLLIELEIDESKINENGSLCDGCHYWDFPSYCSLFKKKMYSYVEKVNIEGFEVNMFHPMRNPLCARAEDLAKKDQES